MASSRGHFIAQIPSPSSIRLSYLDQAPNPSTEYRGTILLLHGFPQTSHQFRHVLPLLAEKGYRCIAPDYRGAGHSSKPLEHDFRKTTMASDIIQLLDHLGINDPVHVVGHDIGGMIAFALASRHPERVRSVCWGECPLPGTEVYRKARTENAVQYFHFILHCVPDLAEALLSGREKIYVQHFLDKIVHNRDAFSAEDVDVYADAYAQPGAMRCAIEMYSTFEEDARENLAWVRENGKCRIPSMVMSGEFSHQRSGAEEMAKEVTEDSVLEVGVVEGAAHYLAEENPEGSAKTVLQFVGKH